MNNKKWINYWKKSLSDSLKSDIEIENLHYFEIENFKIETSFISQTDKVNLLLDIEEKKINNKRRVYRKDDEKWVNIYDIEILIAPLKVKNIPENLVYYKDSKTKFPFWFRAVLDRNGNLSIPEKRFPIFQRKFLEPIADEKSEFIFGTIENVDKATTIGKEDYEDYSEYIGYLKQVFESVVSQDIQNYSINNYEVIRNAIILIPDDEITAAKDIIYLYEKILQEKRLPKLIKTFSNLENEAEYPPISTNNLIQVNALHLGQMGFEFPLSISQRKSLYTLLQSKDTVFAVNGPPGTGKTTLLQSVVANKLVESVINGEQAPIILACSTNNQAVTNIIDSFSKSKTRTGYLHGRWLPKLNGYATYLCASSKKKEDLEGINYKKLNGEGLFGDIENDSYLQEAKSFFIKKSTGYFKVPNSNIKTIVEKIRNEIKSIQSTLENVPDLWKNYLDSDELFINEYLKNISNKQDYYENDILNNNRLKLEITKLNILETEVEKYFKTEPLWRKLLCFFKINSGVKRRKQKINSILRDSPIELPSHFIYEETNILEEIVLKIDLLYKTIHAVENWKNWKSNNSVTGNPPKTEEEYWEKEFLKIKSKSSPNCFYDELDITLRHKAFQLALHFWEGNYLIALEKDLKEEIILKRGKSPSKKRWQRQAMLTPCFVSTFYMSPKFFNYSMFLGKDDKGNNIFDNPPLFNFIDLLIVDEAGQVSPEIGVATFSLAKQTVVVGDLKQIEPVWNTTGKIDAGNLKKCDLITTYKDSNYEDVFDKKGFLSSTGSIMKMSQNACNYKEKNSREKGVMLLEHRRCYNEIIDYCNNLAYNGKLIPLKGNANNSILFPPMYCIHVEGNSNTINGSRYNQSEVDAILKWILTHKDSITHKYGDIEENLGIITPFTGQKNKLKFALKQAGFDTFKMKVGTVHALQGAQRPIIIFSTVYGYGDSGTMFFDRDNKPNMLNVAVSRAEDNFIVFSNTAILDKNSNTPSGILSRYLIYEQQTLTTI